MKHEFIKTLGEGSFCNVELVRTTKYGCVVRKSIKQCDNKLQIKHILNEIEILKQISSSIKADWYPKLLEHDDSSLIMEYFSGRDLFDTKFKITDQETLHSWIEILKSLHEAIAHLHSINMAHRDIKLENILYNGKIVKLVDYGFSAQLNKLEYRSKIGTVDYFSPEIMKNTILNVKQVIASDYWAYGVILYELAYNERGLYPNSKISQLYRWICNDKPERHFPIYHKKKLNEMDPYVNQTILLLLDNDTNTRINNFNAMFSNYRTIVTAETYL